MQPENTTSRQEAILNSLAQGATRTDAAHTAGIHRRTIYNWIEQDSAFKQAVEDAEEECIDIARGLAFDCAMQAQEDPRYLRALFFYLKCKAGWSDRPKRQSAAVSPDLVKEIAAEVIHTLQTLGLVPTHPETTTHPKTPENHVQSVQSVQSTPAEPTPNPVGAQRAAPSPTNDATTSANPKSPENHVQRVQSVQPPPSPAPAPNPTKEQLTTDHQQPTKSVQSVQPPHSPSPESKIGNPKSKMKNTGGRSSIAFKATPQLFSQQQDAQRGRAFRNKLYR
ncbi:MAG TPA: hypothetical protein VFG50_03860 [Rhodothermales bacterium]|nr:hypothetical protein [Rhodothermales bacterium]